MLDDGLAPAFEAMIDHGLVFDALVLPKHLPALLELTARYPDLAMVLDHGAKPPIAAGDLERLEAGDRRARPLNAHGLQTLGPGHRSGQRGCCGTRGIGRSPARTLRPDAHDVGQRLAGVRAGVLV